VATGVSPGIGECIVDGSKFWSPQDLSVKIHSRTVIFGPLTRENFPCICLKLATASNGPEQVSHDEADAAYSCPSR
jgi:hypothetical protein